MTERNDLVKLIWERTASPNSLTVVKSCERSESLQGVTERSEGVFSSALRKFKSPILGGKRALFCLLFSKKENGNNLFLVIIS
jgi:hypothetical protein